MQALTESLYKGQIQRTAQHFPINKICQKHPNII